MSEPVFVQVISGEAPKWYQEYRGCVFIVQTAEPVQVWGFHSDGTLHYQVKEEEFSGSFIESSDCKVVNITPEQYKEALFIRELGEVSRKHGKCIEGYYGYALLVAPIGVLDHELPPQDSIPHYHWDDTLNQYISEGNEEEGDDDGN